MKITIDTKEDSPADIRKVIDILAALVEPSDSVTGSSSAEPIVGEGIFGMFNQETPASVPETLSENKEETSVPSQAGEVDGMLSENKEEDVKVPEPDVVDNVKSDKDDEPRVVTY